MWGEVGGVGKRERVPAQRRVLRLRRGRAPCRRVTRSERPRTQPRRSSGHTWEGHVPVAPPVPPQRPCDLEHSRNCGEGRGPLSRTQLHELRVRLHLKLGEDHHDPAAVRSRWNASAGRTDSSLVGHRTRHPSPRVRGRCVDSVLAETAPPRFAPMSSARMSSAIRRQPACASSATSVLLPRPGGQKRSPLRHPAPRRRRAARGDQDGP